MARRFSAAAPAAAAKKPVAPVVPIVEKSTENENLDPEPATEFFPDPFPELADLFGDGESPVRVELYRVSPKFIGDIPINGYLERLTPESCNHEYVKTIYGGGKFRVIKRPGSGSASGDFLKQYYFDIAGAPKQPAIATAAAVPRLATDSPAAAPAAIANYDGLPITGDLKKDMETVKSVLVFKEMLRGREPDLTKELLQLLLADRRPAAADPLATIRELGPTLAALRELLPGAGDGEGSGSTGFNDIIKTALMTFGEYLKTARAVPRAGTPAAVAPAPGPRIAPPDPPAPLELAAENNSITDPADPPAPEENNMSLTPQGMIDSAVQAIVQSYRLGKEPERVIAFLNGRVPLNNSLRKEYLAHRREELFDMAEMLLDNDLEDYSSDAPGRAKFAEFWNKVFDGFLAGGE